MLEAGASGAVCSRAGALEQVEKDRTMSDNLYASPAEPSDPLAKPKRPFLIFVKLLGLLGVVVLLIGLFLPLNRGREAARRTQCKNNLKQIGLALHAYHDVYEALPPAYTVDANGKPLHSWRTLILPYIDEVKLYNAIDLSRPWNDPANAEAFKTAPTVYCCPSARLPDGSTAYLAVVGPDFCFHPTQPRAFSDVTDGFSNTLMVIEVAQENAVPWMSPQDADEQTVLSFLKTGTLAHTGGTQTLLMDGSAMFLSQNVDPNTLRALTTIAGKEVMGEF